MSFIYSSILLSNPDAFAAFLLAMGTFKTYAHSLQFTNCIFSPEQNVLPTKKILF